jgi:hypothetical protein
VAALTAEAELFLTQLGKLPSERRICLMTTPVLMAPAW